MLIRGQLVKLVKQKANIWNPQDIDHYYILTS
jgi:hypothetical protein